MTISVTCTGNDPDEVYSQLMTIAERMKPQTNREAIRTSLHEEPDVPKKGSGGDAPPEQPRLVTVENTWGYRPEGVGFPEPSYSPIDDGTEYIEEALRDWLGGCYGKGLDGIKVLAQHCVIDTREAAKLMGYDKGYGYSGVWNGPRNQAARVRQQRGITSWPYGHTYSEPRKLWMHPKIAERVLRTLNGHERSGAAAALRELSEKSTEAQEAFLDQFYEAYSEAYNELYETGIKASVLVQRIMENYYELARCVLQRMVENP